MKHHHRLGLMVGLLVILGGGWFAYADDPTSKFVPLAPVVSNLAPSSTGLVVQFEIWDQAAGGAQIYTEAHTVDTDADSNISNDTNFADLLLGRPNGLNPANFPYGSSRYLDVTVGGVSVLPARQPLYASVFSLTDSGSFSGNLTLVGSTPTAGNLMKGSDRFLHNYGSNNTFLGFNSGNFTTTGGGNVGSGYYTLYNNTSGSGNTATGVSALFNNTGGGSNTATGAFALSGNTNGGGNTAGGYFALQNNTIGSYNTASGLNALVTNRTGSHNTASGAYALAVNTDGNQNTATGNFALQYNTANGNTASGYSALQNNTTGDGNTASGWSALQMNSTGVNNTGSGWSALTSNTTGRNNTATGLSALYHNTIGNQNTASGGGALIQNRDGQNNTANGYNALRSNITGSNNTAIGFGADVGSSNLTNATAIGAGAIVAQSNSLVLGNNANVGIGTTSPAAKLHVVGTTRTQVLQITGGADLSEQFEVSGLQKWASRASLEQIKPGMIASIDPDNPGKLIVSSKAYDRRVAGIISGAGGIRPGMLMGQAGSVADGAHPVALTGRVYAWVDASQNPVEPGDLLTTSDHPGHAMKVTDYAKAQGAIIGKAMTGLKEGKGLVLVLVTLQ